MAVITSFTLNWSFIQNTLGFYLDVHTDPDFPDDDPSAPFIIQNRDVGLVNTYTVGDDPSDPVVLSGYSTYYCRLRGYNDVGTGPNSETIIIS